MSNIANLFDIIDKMHGKKVLVLGDPIHDVYHHGHVDRLCPEAPVPVFVEDGFHSRDGGAANVAKTLHALGMVVATWFPQGRWDTKHRYMVGQHVMLRVDKPVWYGHDVPTVLTRERKDVVVISDYAKGWVTPERIATVMDLATTVVVDPKGQDWGKYAGASIVCPNHKEMGPWQGVGAILEKCGAEGLRLHRRGMQSWSYVPKPVRVYDVTGAGDVVTAVMAAALSVTDNVEAAVQLAGLAAAWSVGEVGTVEVSANRLRGLIPCE